MVGLGGPPFISDWAKAVGRFADVTGIAAVAELPTGARTLAQGIALGCTEGFDTIFVKRRKLRPSRYFWRANVWLEARALIRAVEAVEAGSGDFQAVHSHFYSMAMPVVRLAGRISAYHLHTEHSSRLVVAGPELGPSGAGRRMLARAFRSIDEVFVVSDSLADALRSYGVARKLHVVPNPVDDSLFWPADDAVDDRVVRLVTVGSLIARKDHRLLLEAFALLTERSDRPVHLTIVGEGELRDELEMLAERLGLGVSVSFRGWLGRADIAALLRSSHVYVHTAQAETFGVAIAEAQLTGLPVVACAAGGLTSQILPNQGATVTRGSSRELMEALSEVINCLNRFDRQSIATYAKAAFSIDSVAATVSRIYAPYLHLHVKQRTSSGGADREPER
jgi:glycosyltransferase involved in cell wall biosynthesis